RGLAVIRQLLRGKRSDNDLRYDIRSAWVAVIEGLWPEGADVDPIVDVVCAASEHRELTEAYGLARVVEAHLRPEHRAMRRLLEARAAGWSGELEWGAVLLRRVVDGVGGSGGG
ncbi:MAG: hypothetical protein ACOC1F_13495, partial [Myxococcota bacterium]